MPTFEFNCTKCESIWLLVLTKEQHAAIAERRFKCIECGNYEINVVQYDRDAADSLGELAVNVFDLSKRMERIEEHLELPDIADEGKKRN